MRSTKTVIVIFLILIAMLVVYMFWGVLRPFFIAALLAYLLSPLVELLKKKTKLKHGIAVAIVVLAFFVLIAGLIALTLPAAINQISGVINEIGAYAGSFDELVEKLSGMLAELHLPEIVQNKAQELLSDSNTYLMRALSSVLSALINFSLGLFDIVIVVIVMVYLMLDGKKLIRNALNALPASLSVRLNRVMHHSNQMTWKYFRSRVIVSAGMGVVTYIGLRIMGLKYALLFAFLSFVLDFIPYFGSIIGGAVESLYALIVGGWGLALAVLIFVIVVQQIEGNVIAPKVQADATGLHPITIMFALLACYKVWGAIGMLISTPVAVVVKVIFMEIYDYLITPDRTPEPVIGAGRMFEDYLTRITVPGRRNNGGDNS